MKEVKDKAGKIIEKFSGVLLTAAMLSVVFIAKVSYGDEISLKKFAYRIEEILFASAAAVMVVWVCLSILFIWPKNKLIFIRKLYGIATYRALKNVEASIMLVSAICLFFFLMWLIAAIFTENYKQHSLVFAGASVFMAIIYMSIEKIRRELFPTQPKKREARPVYGGLVVILLGGYFWAISSPKEQNVVVSIKKETLNRIIATKAKETNYQKWINFAIQEKLERDNMSGAEQ